MKKTVALLSGFLLLTIMLQAQQKQSRFMVEVSGGPSFPVGKFGDKSFNHNDRKTPEGLAETGVSASLSVGYYLNKKIGLLLSGGYSSNKQNWESYPNDLVRAFPGIDLAPGLKITAENWEILNVMGGGFFEIPLNAAHTLNFRTKLTAGACKTAIPERTSKSDIGEFTEKKMDLPWGFCYQASAGLQYKLNNSLHVLLDVNSFNAIAQKSQWQYPPSPGNTYPVTSKFHLNSVNALAGIGLSF
jgi:outer membrane protein W